MSAGTGENEMGLRKILDFTRLGGIFILLLHFYYQCYQLFVQWELTAIISDCLLLNISRTGLFNSIYACKAIAIALLVISLVGARGKKEENLKARSIISGLLAGLLIYFFSHLVFALQADDLALGV